MKKGIDISEHNGNIDFQKVKQNGVEFVIIRIGWIGNRNNHTIDKKFQEYVNKACNVGLPYGIYVYNYCQSVEKVKEGANWVLDKLRLVPIKPQYPIFLDMEDLSIEYLGKENLTNQCIEFCKIIENAGIKGGVYANKHWFNSKLHINKLISYKIWVAEWNGKDKHSCDFRVDLWQYTSSGNVNGINTRVDMNYCMNCEENNSNNENTNNEGGYQVKIYQNGTTKEPIYQDTNCQKQIGYLNPHETAECYGVINNLALVVYNVDKTGYKKTGFAKWLGGIK